MSRLPHTSSFTSELVNVKFKGRNVFARNNGGGTGAAAFQNCVINVQGQLLFMNNSGTNGGAVLLESSQIILYPDSEMMFLGNKARGPGGAICVFNNLRCFLAYSDLVPPSKWKVRISSLTVLVPFIAGTLLHFCM